MRADTQSRRPTTIMESFVAMIFMPIFAAFSGTTVALIVPFSRIIFYEGSIEGPPAASETAPER